MEKDEMAKIYDRWKNTVYRTALTYCRNISDAEDITQEVFITRFNTDKIFESDENEKAWLIRVTINRSINLLKSFRYRNRIAFEEIELICEAPEEIGLFNAVNKLPNKYRIVFYLYYVEGYSASEIALLTSQSETNVQTKLYRARKKLKKMLKGEIEE